METRSLKAMTKTSPPSSISPTAMAEAIRVPVGRVLFPISGLIMGIMFSATAFAGADTNCPMPESTEGERWSGKRQWELLEEQGYRLGTLTILVDDVYDTPPDERLWYENLANTLHLNSDQDVIAAALTIHSGGTVQASKIYQAERNLRGLPFLLDATIRPVACRDGLVDAVVRAHDAWTLSLSVGLSSTGGKSSSSLRLEDRNFLGTGKTVKFDRSDDPERTTTEFTYRDPNLFGSYWTFEGTHQSLSDGRSNFAALAYPFRTYDQPWAFRAAGGDTTSTLYYYDLGETAWIARSVVEEQDLQVRRLLSEGGDNGWRGGVGWRYENHRYFDPEEITPGVAPQPDVSDRELSGGYLLIERFHDHYAGFRNIQAMDRNEDYNLGLNARFMLGNYAVDTGGKEDALFIGASISWGSSLSGNGLLLVDAKYEGRRTEEVVGGAYGEVTGTAYLPSSDDGTWVVHLETNWLDDPDPEQQIYIGGIEGLLGYPAHFRRGEKSWRGQLEYRYTSEHILFKTLRIGYTAFLQAAQVKRPGGNWDDVYSNIGGGFRFGNLRSSFSNTIYVGVAAPLRKTPNSGSWQFFVADEISF